MGLQYFHSIFPLAYVFGAADFQIDSGPTSLAISNWNCSYPSMDPSANMSMLIRYIVKCVDVLVQISSAALWAAFSLSPRLLSTCCCCCCCSIVILIFLTLTSAVKTNDYENIAAIGPGPWTMWLLRLARTLHCLQRLPTFLLRSLRALRVWGYRSNPWILPCNTTCSLWWRSDTRRR